jgi:hypothetical protein
MLTHLLKLQVLAQINLIKSSCLHPDLEHTSEATTTDITKIIVINNIISHLIHIYLMFLQLLRGDTMNKRPLISESVPMIQIIVHHIGENLTHMTYVPPWTGHVWQAFTMKP